MSRGAVLAVFLIFAVLDTIRADNCDAQQKAIDSLRVRIKADQNAIRQLNPGLSATELSNWADATEAERQAILKKSIESGISTLADGLLSAPENALEPMDIAGYHLPNGIGSLGTGQANTIIGRLQRSGASNTLYSKAVIGSLRELRRISGKTGSLEYLKVLSKVGSALKDTAEMGASDETVGSAAAFFQLVADLAGKGDFAVQLGSALFQGAKNEFDAYFISSAVSSLKSASESQLNALKALGANLQRDVQALQNAKAKLDTCINRPPASLTNTADSPCMNPAALVALRTCDNIAFTMGDRQRNLAAIRSRCPKATRPGEEDPPCPEYDRAAVENRAINRSSMTCNKDASGGYIPLIGSCEGRGSATISQQPSPVNSSDMTDLDKAIQFLDWFDKGNRSFHSPEERQQFYINFPGLRKYETIAETSSPASDPSAADQAEFSKLLGQAQARSQSLQQDVGGLRDQLHDLNTEVSNVDRDFTKAQVDRQKLEQANPSSPLSLSPAQPRIPPGWVPCTCPPDHPGAGIFVNGVQYHTPLLRCPTK
jgi:hypothetical protein